MNTTQGELSLALLNISLTLAAPTPTYISTNSEPETYIKGTPDSPAIALANIVFPVPDGPYSITPFGSLAPIFLYFLLSWRKSTTCCNSSFASSFPAISLNFTSDFSGSKNLAPDSNAGGPPGPPLELGPLDPEPPVMISKGPFLIYCILSRTLLTKVYVLHIRKLDRERNIIKRRRDTGDKISILFSSTENETPFSFNSLTEPASPLGLTTLNLWSPILYNIWFSLIVTTSTFLDLTLSIKCE